ncbi:hypothetical protein PsYK624_107580 [Phanerochaete sordida]|uniref:Uncharacterized protein n=1 Tax=Phanerochaete sordida TaxID=48140 RepID=A0A9P3LH57_9APHY|nr:hypothetical protein PsYK624_107580 [Phanerochaete sordida]
MQVTDTHARHFVQVGHKLFRQSNGYQCRSLTTLRLDFNVIEAVPKQVFAQLTELDIYNLDGGPNREIFDDYLQSARRLRSLTLQRWQSPSFTETRGFQIKPGEVLAPNAPDEVDRVLAEDAEGEHGDLTTMADSAGRTDDPLQRLTSFRYIAYRGVMSPRVCRGVLHFLEKRTGLRRVDIKAVFCNKHYAEQALRVLGRFRHLEVLGIEFRDARNGLSSGLELLRYIPRTVTHLKYNVIGWRLDETPSTPDTVVKRALDKCPQLQFLYVYDGIRFLNGDYFRREDGKPQLSTPVRHFDFKQLRFLAIEYNWMDIVHNSRGGADVARWSEREALYGGLEGWERLGADGEWLARYNADIMCLSTYA